MTNPYQAPGAAVGDPPSTPAKGAVLMGVAVGSTAAIALVWVAPMFSVFAVAYAFSSQRLVEPYPLTLAIQLILVYLSVYLCSLLAMRIAKSNPYRSAIPLGVIVSAFLLWEWAGIDLAALEDAIWQPVLLVPLPLVAATVAAFVASRP